MDQKRENPTTASATTTGDQVGTRITTSGNWTEMRTPPKCGDNTG